MRLSIVRLLIVLLGLVAVVTGARSVVAGLSGVISTLGPTEIELDNNLRFLSAIWATLGLALWTCARDPVASRPALRVLLWLVFAGGVGRLVAFAIHGLPAPPYMGIAASELLAPLLLLLLPRQAAHHRDLRGEVVVTQDPRAQ